MNALVGVTYEADLARFHAGEKPLACWACSPDPQYCSAPWSKCTACLTRASAADARERDKNLEVLAAEEAKERARADSDARAVLGFFEDKRRAEFERNVRKEKR